MPRASGGRSDSTAAQEISFGVHGDRYRLENPVYQSPVWYAVPLGGTGTGQLYSTGVGETSTGALWLQDAWKIQPNLKLILGGRLESWRAFDGFNVNTATTATDVNGTITPANTFPKVQPQLNSTNFSPKASLSWDTNKDWNVTANFGEAWRYPTVTELYQNVTANGVVFLANPLLAPEHDYTGELNIERHWNDGRVRLTIFREQTYNALISQTTTVTDTKGAQSLQSAVTNVDAIRMQGVELSADKNNVGVRGLQVFGSVTYVNSRILADAGWKGTDPITKLPDTVIGKRVPNVPQWRAKLGFTYRPNDSWAYTFAGRYTSKQYATLDNSDTFQHVYRRSTSSSCST